MARSTTTKDPERAVESHPAKTRSDALCEVANMTKRNADRLLDQEQARHKTMAGFSGAGGLLGLLLAAGAAAGLGPPLMLLGLAGAAVLIPTIFALRQASAASEVIAQASYERGLCQALSSQAKRLGDAVGSTDLRNIPLGPEAIINGQLDILYRDIDRAKQRLRDAGADGEQQAVMVRANSRIVPGTTETMLTATDGRRYPVHIIDVSPTRVAVRGTMPKLFRDEHVQIGNRKATVFKATPRVLALTFVSPIAPAEFNRKLVL